jgi:hypothetical protein
MPLGLPSRIYRLAVRLYPATFRRRFGTEMVRVFEEGWRDARPGGAMPTSRYIGRIAGDLLVSAGRERLAAMNRASLSLSALAIVCGCVISYIDFHASEVQATLLVILVCNSLLGFFWPKRAWRQALLVGVCLPAIHVIAFSFSDRALWEWRPYLSRLMILAPSVTASVIGAYVGVLARYWIWRPSTSARQDGGHPGCGAP